MFDCKYPIIAAPMNQVSELNLAIAVHNAGGFPSISGYCYETPNHLITDLEDFVKITGSSNLILAIDEHWLLNANIVSTVRRLNISHLFKYFNENPKFSLESKLSWREPIDKLLNTLDCKIIKQLSNFSEIEDLDTIYFIKGSEGAGRPGVATTKELFEYYRQTAPDAKLVPVGGIGTANQVKHYIDNGAVAVSVGTLLAASAESCLTKEVKLAIVSAKKEDVVPFDNCLKQNSLIFKKVNGNDNMNNTGSLKVGIKSNANVGHVFLGRGVDNITAIESTEYIIKNLVANIK
jgi:NAD(P)H-dependent flavin oxidoreductase YrpB (nitropropane dioxygenase family)